MIGASLNRCKRMEDQAGAFLKQLAVKLELVLLFSIRGGKSQPLELSTNVDII